MVTQDNLKGIWDTLPKELQNKLLELVVSAINETNSELQKLTLALLDLGTIAEGVNPGDGSMLTREQMQQIAANAVKIYTH